MNVFLKYTQIVIIITFVTKNIFEINLTFGHIKIVKITNISMKRLS